MPQKFTVAHLNARDLPPLGNRNYANAAIVWKFPNQPIDPPLDKKLDAIAKSAAFSLFSIGLKLPDPEQVLYAIATAGYELEGIQQLLYVQIGTRGFAKYKKGKTHAA